MLDQLIEQFISSHHLNFDNPDHVQGECHGVSLQFIEKISQYGIKSELIHLMDYIGPPFLTMHPNWSGHEFLNHYVVRIGDSVYDFTRRQFDEDAPVPFVQQWSNLEKEWDTIASEPDALSALFFNYS